jgi:hypothetical protein
MVFGNSGLDKSFLEYLRQRSKNKKVVENSDQSTNTDQNSQSLEKDEM